MRIVFADRVFIHEQNSFHRRAEHADIRGEVHFLIAERRALLHRPGSDVEIVWRRAGDAGVPVLVPVDHLLAAGESRRGLRDERDFFQDGVHVVHGEGPHAAVSLPHATRAIASRRYEDGVRPHGLNALLDDVLRALSNADDGDHRAHSDDDAQHRQGRAHLVARQGPQCETKCVHEVHVRFTQPPESCSRIRLCQSLIFHFRILGGLLFGRGKRF